MTAPLSDDARALAGGLFGVSPGMAAIVRFSRPWDITPRAATAFGELVDAGLVGLAVQADGVAVYRTAMDCREHYDWLRAVMHTGVGRFPLLREADR